MDGCLYFLIMALLLGQSLPMVLVICWRLLFGAYSSRLLFDWSLPEEFDAADAVLRLCQNRNVWTDGSLVLDEVSGASS